MHTTPLSGPWIAALVARMRQRHVALTPTLKLWRPELLRSGDTEPEARAAQQIAVDQLRTFVRAGGEVLFGTDVVAPKDTTQYYAVFESYRPLWALLTPDASAKIRRGNYERLFDAARTKVRAWEKAQGW